MAGGRGKRAWFVCVVCGVKRYGWHHQRYCGKKCRSKSQGKTTAYDGLSCGTVGAIQELRVGADLLIKGFEVFRALSPSCSCDLLVLKEKKLQRIEVRTAYEYRSTKRIYASGGNRTCADVMAYALPDRIEYDPKLA